MIYSILEGKQAEEYKARKAKEKEDIELGFKKQASKRYPRFRGSNYGNKYSYNHPEVRKDTIALFNGNDRNKSEKGVESDNERQFNAATKVIDHLNKTGNELARDWRRGQNPNFNRMVDATNRHMRRHPKQYAKPKNESTIFSHIEII